MAQVEDYVWMWRRQLGWLVVAGEDGDVGGGVGECCFQWCILNNEIGRVLTMAGRVGGRKGGNQNIHQRSLRT